MRRITGLLLLLGAAAANAAEIEIQSVRERLTEREDETRVEKPFTVRLFNHPLSVLGQYEVNLEHASRLALGEDTERYGQVLLDQEVELEVFYTFGPWLSFLVQPKLVMEKDLDSNTPEGVSDIFFERGEMWLHSARVAGLPVSIEIGRLSFEDDRRWWWDEDLDAARVVYENQPETFEVALAVARELFPVRSDRDYIAPEHEKVFRLIGETSWDWQPEHAVQLFALYHNDHSWTERPGDVIRLTREDESDAELLWLGLRLTGAADFRERGVLGYWLEVAGVCGQERVIVTEDISPSRSEVTEVIRQDVRGWAVDAGLTWLLPVAFDPRITIGYAIGSGDANAEDRADHAFRQTGLQGNEPGYGGVQKFNGYGRLLEPELSNLAVVTVGVGCSLFTWSSVDLVFHDYRQVEPAESVRDARLDAALTGKHREIGQGVDLVFAFEEWERIEFEASVSVFRAGQAFGPDRDEWIWGSFLAVRVAF